ncbi:MAG TPA: PhaM family polyhydroxyalkanoate granule multifunctional regulatory protein [Burkholderiales bacterium]
MSQGSDPFEFIKNFWAGVPGMGAGAVGGTAMPSFDPQDLEKRLTELKQVKQWLEMNLNMLNLQINTIEMQLSAVNSFEHYTQAAEPASARKKSPEPAPDMRQANEAASAAARAAGDAGAQAFAQGAQALQAMPWANPGEWIKSMQAAFAAAAPASPAGQKSAPRKRAATAKRSAAKRTAAKRNPPKPPRNAS